MNEFSDRDIKEAKRRVLEMQNKASHFLDGNYNQTEVNRQAENKSITTENEKPENDNKLQNNTSGSDDNSLFVILALILLLSREKADNTLIFALLYLLL